MVVMDKITFLIKLKEAQIRKIENDIYEENKDSAVRTNYLQRKYQLDGINIPDIYRRIVNYQIKRYGKQLEMSTSTQLTPQDIERLRVNARNRKKSRLGK